jgi:hypothetical protein
MHSRHDDPTDGEPPPIARGFQARVARLRHRDNDVQIFVALQQKLH